jgi:hypothetical protein
MRRTHFSGLLSVRGAGVASALALVASAMTPAQADGHDRLSQQVADALSHHVDFCAVALADPDGFFDHVAARLPAGHFAQAETPDGRIYRVMVVENNGSLTTQLSRYEFGMSVHLNCVTYFSDYDGLSPLDALGRAYVDVLSAQVGADAVAGGATDSFSAAPGSSMLVNNGVGLEYLVDGIFPGLPVRTISGLHDGYMSFVTELIDAQ